jgi:hypothetical protein
MHSKLPFAVLAVLLALVLGAPAAHAADAHYEGISSDGAVALFSTEDRLVPGDTDTRRDVYERSFDPVVEDFVTRQVSLGPTGGNHSFHAQYYGASGTGKRVFFKTEERLTVDDTDTAADIYMRDLSVNKTVRISRGAPGCGVPACGNGNSPAEVVPGGVALDGTRAFFLSFERLASGDTDNTLDIYARDMNADATILVSAGTSICAPACGNSPDPVLGFEGAATDGSRVFFSTEEDLVEGDDDGLRDIYVRDLGDEETELVSGAGVCPGDLPPEQNCEPTFGGASPDGAHAFFETNERLSLDDGDSFQDVYDWSAGDVSLASTGTGDDDDFHALYAGASHDGDSVFFETGEPLDAVLDTDGAQDVYERSGGATTLISRAEGSCVGNCGNGEAAATLRWVSPDGTSAAAIFSSVESLVAADGDESQDVYMRENGATALLSRGEDSCAGLGCGDGAFDANFAGASSDASHVFFVSDEALVANGDPDSVADIYERTVTATRLVSTGPLPAKEIPSGNLTGISADGTRAYFVTDERLTVDDDFAAEDDVYLRSDSGTLLVSVGNDPGLAIEPDPPTLTHTDPGSPSPSTQPSIVGESQAGAEIKLYSTPNCSGEPVETGTAEELASPGISVTVALGSTTSFHATAEIAGILSECSNGIAYTQASDTPSEQPPDDEPDTGGAASPPAAGVTAKPDARRPDRTFLTPDTLITFAPAGRTLQRRPVFRFADATGQEGTRFRCKVDRGRWRDCRSPLRLKRLRLGRHVIKVRAVNGGGEWEFEPARRGFKVVAG